MANFSSNSHAQDSPDGYHNIMVVGAPGAGKTSVARLLARELGLLTVLEDLNANEFVNPYFDEPGRWAFHLSVAFMLRSIENQAAVSSQGLERSVCWDYDPRCHHEVFCQQLHSRGLLTVGEAATCEQLHGLLLQHYREPTMRVCLVADASLLSSRLRRRNRPGETANLSSDYVEELASRFNKWYEVIGGETVVVDMSQLDVVARPEDARVLVDLVKARMVSTACRLDGDSWTNQNASHRRLRTSSG